MNKGRHEENTMHEPKPIGDIIRGEWLADFMRRAGMRNGH